MSFINLQNYPIFFAEVGICTSYGGHHITTYSGSTINYQSDCHYILSETNSSIIQESDLVPFRIESKPGENDGDTQIYIHVYDWVSHIFMSMSMIG